MQWMIDEAWVQVRWIDSSGNEKARIHRKKGLDPQSVIQSLLKMRDSMLSHESLVAAFFVGGKQGIVDEFEQFVDIAKKNERPCLT